MLEFDLSEAMIAQPVGILPANRPVLDCLVKGLRRSMPRGRHLW